MTAVSSPIEQPRSTRFRSEREREWVELEDLVDRASRRGLRSLSQPELQRLPVVYRSAVASLSVARRTALDRALVAYLEALAARAYMIVYASRRPTRGALRTFLAEIFPRAVRARARELVLATALFLLGVGVAAALVRADASWYYAFVDPMMAQGRDPTASTAHLRRVLYDGENEKGLLTTFASFLFTHNARIGMLAFALGFAAGIPTALLLFVNGLTLGAFVALYASRGLLVPLLGWLLPHGVPEIGAMLLCGAAGLAVGRAVIHPGGLRVRDALARVGRETALVVGGAIALFVMAGVIEGIFRQVVRSDAARFGLAAFNALFLAVWLIGAGRGRRRRERSW